jgi:predicted PurR-regulated permease PerM
MSEPADASPRERSTLSSLLVAEAVLGIIVLVVVAFRIVLVLFAGVLFALALHAICGWVARKSRVPYVAVLCTVVFVGLGVVILTSVLLAPALVSQLEALARDLPRALDLVRGRLAHAGLLPHGAGPGPPGALLGAGMSALGSSVEVITALVVVFFVGVYGAAQPEAYLRAVLAVTPTRHRPEVRRALQSGAVRLERWLVGRLVAMVFVGVTTSIVFALLGVPLALLLGILSGLLTFIEYAGAVISAVLPVLFAFEKSAGTGIAVLLLFLGVHVIEGYVLTPMLSRASFGCPPR